ncbi:MAG: DUF4332 domain-containing protein [Chloroflexi bacterium]|nr:DUF4332 domain-containing protein [Chloroflexota bacterium]
MAKTARNWILLGVGLSISGIVGWFLLKENKRQDTSNGLMLGNQNQPAPEEAPQQIVLPMDDVDTSTAAEDTERAAATAPEETVLPEVTDEEDHAPAGDAEVTGISTPETDTAADDLTQINGIGPRFAEALHAIGIMHFAQLAAQDPDDLAGKLAEHVRVRPDRIRSNDWLGQAAQLAGDQ